MVGDYVGIASGVGFAPQKCSLLTSPTHSAIISYQELAAFGKKSRILVSSLT